MTDLIDLEVLGRKLNSIENDSGYCKYGIHNCVNAAPWPTGNARCKHCVPSEMKI